MIDEPGSFYICTETSPRCYIIQKVSAKHVDQVVSDLKWLENGGETGPYTVDQSFGVPQQTGRCASPPPLPVLPWWFTSECERELEKSDTIWFDEDMIVEEPDMIPMNSSPDCQMNFAPACSPLEIQVDAHPEASHSAGASSGTPDDFSYLAGPDGLPNGLSQQFSSGGPALGLSPRTPEELRILLKAQLEYYFSRENLSTDRYLRSQMDNDQYVPIRIIAGFPKVIALTSDLDLIVTALKESPNVQVDEKGERVRPAAKRCVIILREIPESTDKKEMEALFSHEKCPPFTSVDYGLNNSWYVTFETEEATQRAFLYLQTQVKKFKGKPIFARIKAGKAPASSAIGGTPSPQTSVQEEQNGSRQVPQSLPISTVSPGAEQVQVATSPSEMGFAAQPYVTWTPSPSGTPGAPPLLTVPVMSHTCNFDLGYVLHMNGYAPRGVHRPPATLLQVPPGAMAASLQAAVSAQRSSPPLNYRQPSQYPAPRYAKGSRGRGSGYHSQSYADKGPDQQHSRSSRGSHSGYGPRRPNSFNRQSGHYGRPHENNFDRSSDKEQSFNPANRRRYDRDHDPVHHDKIRGRPPLNRRYPGARSDYSYHSPGGFNEGRRSGAINEDWSDAQRGHDHDGFFDPNDQASFPCLPTTKSDDQGLPLESSETESKRSTSPTERVPKQVQPNCNHPKPKANRNWPERDQKPIAPSFSSVAAGTGSTHTPAKEESKREASSSASPKVTTQPTKEEEEESAVVCNASGPKKLSYAQMAQKKKGRSVQSPSESGSLSSEGGHTTPPPSKTQDSEQSPTRRQQRACEHK